ncbi:MAG TPA: hypothetical protein VHW23_21205 [Kofleriaceae bacterium]|jgi:hypothetical protein|nr:hypothetical protein [Kofleriaceae bacterium]
MHPRSVLLALLAALTPSCKTVDCGNGTTERNGSCVASSETVTSAQCGALTELQGNICVPKFPPTVCDPSTTAEEIDPSTGVVTCVGTGAGGCSARLACPTPTDGTQAICGQIFDFETGQAFTQTGATGAACNPAAPTSTGPCSLGIHAFDAVAFVGNPMGTPPLTTSEVYLDDCGRYRIEGIAQPSGPFIALAIDDAAPAAMGAAGSTNPVGIATGKLPNTATRDLDGYVVKGATAAGWGMPPLASGIYAAVYHAKSTGPDLASGVMTTFGAATSPPPTTVNKARTFYFGAAATMRTTIDTSALATGANGAALISGATLMELYGGTGGIPATCAWEIHAGAAIPGVVFIQSFRPTNAPGMTCPL